jgi:hypothetical protein
MMENIGYSFVDGIPNPKIKTYYFVFGASGTTLQVMEKRDWGALAY